MGNSHSSHRPMRADPRNYVYDRHGVMIHRANPNATAPLEGQMAGQTTRSQAGSRGPSAHGFQAGSRHSSHTASRAGSRHPSQSASRHPSQSTSRHPSHPASLHPSRPASRHPPVRTGGAAMAGHPELHPSLVIRPSSHLWSPPPRPPRGLGRGGYGGPSRPGGSHFGGSRLGGAGQAGPPRGRPPPGGGMGGRLSSAGGSNGPRTWKTHTSF